MNAFERRSGTLLAICVVATLLGGVAVAAALGDKIRFFDEREYIAVGRHIADDGAIQLYNDAPTAYRTPGYPLVIAFSRMAGLGLPAARFANFLFLALTVVAAYALGRVLAGRAAGALAAVLTTTSPFFAYTATTFYPQTLAGLLLLLALLTLVHALRQRGRKRVVLALGSGLCSGALALVVPTFAYVAPLTLLWLLLSHREALTSVAVPLLIAALVLPSIWTVRNYGVFDSFVPLATSSGFNLLVGNHPGAKADGRYDSAYMEPLKRRVRRRGLDEVGADDFYGRTAENWIGAHTGRALTLYMGKLLNNFSWDNALATERQNSGFKGVLGAVAYLPLLALLLVRLAAARRRRLLPIEWLMLAIMVVNALVLAVYTTRLRYRLPVDTLMIVIVALFLVGLVEGHRRAQGPQKWSNAPASGLPAGPGQG